MGRQSEQAGKKFTQVGRGFLIRIRTLGSQVKTATAYHCGKWPFSYTISSVRDKIRLDCKWLFRDLNFE